MSLSVKFLGRPFANCGVGSSAGKNQNKADKMDTLSLIYSYAHIKLNACILSNAHSHWQCHIEQIAQAPIVDVH